MALPESPKSFLRYEKDPEFKAGIDRLFQQITPPVEEFIVRNGVSIERWHQSIPIWVLNWTRPDNLQRIIQIGTDIDETDSPTLTFSAYAYEDTPEKREYSERIPVGFINSTSLFEDPDLPVSLLSKGFNTANNITTTEP